MSTELKNKEKDTWNRFLSQRETFARESEKPYSFGALWTFVHRRNFETMLRLIGDVKGRTILDVGCGVGWVSEWFALEGASTVGLDISLEFCRAMKVRAAKKGFDTSIVCADGENLPFKSNSFSASVFYQSLHHMPNPKRAISEALRTSKLVVSGDEPVKPLFPEFLVGLLKILALSSLRVGELSGMKQTRFDPLEFSREYQEKGYAVMFQRQWSMVPRIMSRIEKHGYTMWVFRIIYEFLMKTKPIRNMGHGFTMMIKRQDELELGE